MSKLPIIYVVVALAAALGATISPAAPPEARPSVERRALAAPVPVPGPVASQEASTTGEGSHGTSRVRRVLVAHCRGGPRALGTVELGQRWLKTAQNLDGSWSGGRFDRPDPATTALTLLSFLGCGNTHRHGRHKKTVRNGLKYLKTIQDQHGRYSIGSRPEDVAAHAIATLAMCEVYGHTASPLFKASAQAGLDWISRFRRPYSSVAFWEIMALRSGSLAGLTVPECNSKETREWLDSVTDRDNGLAYCPSAGVLPDTAVGQTAAAIFCRALNGEDPKKSDVIKAGAEIVLARRPGKPGSLEDIGLLYFGTLAMYQCGGNAWRTWNTAMKEHTMADQIREGEHKGSFKPVARLGRAGTTALRLMMKQVYYRYSRVYGLK